MSEHKSEAETNPRRSKRKRVAKLDLDCIHESGIYNYNRAGRNYIIYLYPLNPHTLTHYNYAYLIIYTFLYFIVVAKTNKKAKTLEEDASSKQNETETTNDGGLRRIERKGRFLKGTKLYL